MGVLVAVAVGVCVGVGVLVAVAVGVCVGSGVLVSATVGVCVGVCSGVLVSEAGGREVALGATAGVSKGLASGPKALHATETSPHKASRPTIPAKTHIPTGILLGAGGAGMGVPGARTIRLNGA